MISRKQYNEALDMVEAYQKQLFISSVGSSLRDSGKTKVDDWDKLKKCSTRLSNVLRGVHLTVSCKHLKMEYIEDITFEEFKKFRHAGTKSWNEFVELRGY